MPPNLREARPLRVLLGTWLIASFLISITYSAILTSFRQHPSTTPVIETLALLEKALRTPAPKIRVAVLNDTKYNAILRPDKPSDLISLILNNADFCTSKKDCIDLVLDRTHVFLSTDNNIKWEVGTDPKVRIIHRAKENIDMGRYSIVLQPGSPIQRQIRDFSTVLFEAGIFGKLEALENFRIKPTFNQSIAGCANSPLSLQDMTGTLQLFVGGNLIALSASILEKISRIAQRRLYEKRGLCSKGKRRNIVQEEEPDDLNDCMQANPSPMTNSSLKFVYPLLGSDERSHSWSYLGTFNRKACEHSIR